MRRRSILAAVAFATATVLSPFVGGTAQACTYHVITKLPTEGGLLYIDDRKPATDPLPGLVAENGEGTWIYLEDNGNLNLEWGDPWLGVNELKDINPENCPSHSNPDLMLL